MSTLSIAPPSQQPLLLNVAPAWRLRSNAAARNAYGAVAQELVCAALDLTPIPINGNYDCCFDAWRAPETYYEIKSVRQGCKVVIYDWRILKEQNAGVDVLYAVLCHQVWGSDGTALVDEFIDGGLTCLLAPCTVVHALALAEPLRTLGNGYNRAGYKDGYRNLPVKALNAVLPHVSSLRCLYGGREFKVTLRQAAKVLAKP